MVSKRLFGAALMAAAVLPIVACGDDPLSAVCCKEFTVGADLSGADFGVDASIKGQFTAFAQASGDLAGAATGALDSVAGACKAIAQVGGSNGNAEAPAEPKDRVKFWCDLANARITAAFQAQGSAKAALTIQATPPQCTASFKAEANCQANCSVDASCDVKAKPPTCEGGKLEVSCSGSCTADANVDMSCEGSCSGECSGSCSAEGGVAVDCEGKCDGTCAAGGSANGSGIQADGSCKGTCQGTCTASATAPKLKCSGSCKGTCNATCSAKAGASVKCDGKCEGTAEPISCKGGELKAQCQADANCQANCKASASATAQCTPPSVNIAFSASAQGSVTSDAALVVDALRVNLPQILLVFQARGQAFIDLSGKVVASGSATLDPGKLGLHGTACLAAIVPVLATAGENIKATVDAAGSVAGNFSL